jgi:hypothetical protein
MRMALFPSSIKLNPSTANLAFSNSCTNSRPLQQLFLEGFNANHISPIQVSLTPRHHLVSRLFDDNTLSPGNGATDFLQCEVAFSPDDGPTLIRWPTVNYNYRNSESTQSIRFSQPFPIVQDCDGLHNYSGTFSHLLLCAI